MNILGSDVPEIDRNAFARRPDPDTSKAAADAMDGDPATRLEAMVVHALRLLGGDGTSEEVAIELGMDLQSITPRFRPLANRDVIRDSLRRRAGRSGRMRIVWEIVP